MKQTILHIPKPTTKSTITLSTALVLALCGFSHTSKATDITNSIYNLQNKNDANSGTFSVGSTRTWSTGGASFSQTYTNGTLIFGNTSTTPKKDSSIWFGGDGWQSGLVGYIETKFSAKDIYLTGTIGGGNAWGTGGGVQLDFDSSGGFSAESLDLRLNHAGLQYSNFFVKATNDISFKDSSLQASSDGFKMHLTSTNGEITLDNTKVNFGGEVGITSGKNINLKNGTSITSRGNTIRLKAENGSITGNGNLDFSSGTPIYVGVVEIFAKDKIELGTTKLQVNASSLVGSMEGRIEVKTQDGEKNDISFDTLELVGNNGISAFGTYAHIKAGGSINVKTNGAIYSNRGINNSTDTAGRFRVTLEAGKDITLTNTNISLLNQLAGIGAPDSMTIKAGGNLEHKGTISFLTKQHTWEGAMLDISGVKGSAKLGNIIGSAFYLNANKELSADSIHINARQTNGGFWGTGTQIWTKEGGTYTFTDMTLGECGLTPWGWCEVANTARLSFFGTSGADSSGEGGSGTNSFVKDSTLNITNLNLGTMAGLYASNIQNTNITNINMSNLSTAVFHNLTLQEGGSITMDATSQIQVKSRAYEPNTTPILGKVTLNVTNGTPFLSITYAGENLENLNIQAGKTYRFIDAGEIEYILKNDGTTSSPFHCTDDTEKCPIIKQMVGIYAKDKDSSRLDFGSSTADNFLRLEKAGLKFEKVADYSTIGIKATAIDYKNPYDIDDIRYYIWQKGGDEAVAKIGEISKGAQEKKTTQTRLNSTTAQNKDATESTTIDKVYTIAGKGDFTQSELANCTTESCKKLSEQEKNSAVEKQVTHLESDIFKWFDVLALHQKGVTWTATNMLNYDLSFFEKTAKQLNNTLEQLVSTERKSNAASSVRFASDLAKAQRLVKLARIDKEDEDYRFAELLAQKRYAASGGIKSDAGGVDFGFLYKFSNRHEFYNNLWANALGSASFVDGGYGTLYGANVGYDRFVPLGENGIILGLVASYGYGNYNADLLKNQSHNINAGIYSRTMLKNNEIDVNVGYTIGMNSEDLVTRQNVWLSSLDQSYKYNTHTINANANYGYIFSTKSSGFVFKPNVGVSYYHIFTGALNAESKQITSADNPNAPAQNLAVQSPESERDLIALNLALETRQYLSKGSYWFVNVGAQKDMFVTGGEILQVRFVGEESLNYKKSDNLNTFVLASAGGEVQLGRRMFVNFSLGGKAGLSYKDIGVQANLGSRIVF
ncbi:vacuolating cytotoxin domain-containing protein [Helicobacter sp. T3_23-1056]